MSDSSNPPTLPPNTGDTDIDEILDRLGGMYITYKNRYAREHHNFTRYQQDLRHASAEAKAAIEQKLNEARIDEVRKAIKWFDEESGYLFYLDDRLKTLQATKEKL